MSDYCCGVKQANKQCVWLCNGSIQTFLCVCEAPARSGVRLLNKENLCLTSSPMPGCQRSLGQSGHKRNWMSSSRTDIQTGGKFRVRSHSRERLTAFAGFLKSWDRFYASCVKTLCHRRGIDSPGKWGIHFAWCVRRSTFQVCVKSKSVQFNTKFASFHLI